MIGQLYGQFQELIPHSTDLDKDCETYCEAATFFLLAATSRSIFYGQFVNAATDPITRNSFKPKPTVKRPRKAKKSAIDALIDDLDLSPTVSFSAAH